MSSLIQLPTSCPNGRPRPKPKEPRFSLDFSEYHLRRFRPCRHGTHPLPPPPKHYLRSLPIGTPQECQSLLRRFVGCHCFVANRLHPIARPSHKGRTSTANPLLQCLPNSPIPRCRTPCIPRYPLRSLDGRLFLYCLRGDQYICRRSQKPRFKLARMIVGLLWPRPPRPPTTPI